jgi:hypothetical protein
MLPLHLVQPTLPPSRRWHKQRRELQKVETHANRFSHIAIFDKLTRFQYFKKL